MPPIPRSFALFLMLTGAASAAVAQPAANVAEYSVVFQATWSFQSHPIDFPPNPHFSRLIGGVHRAGVSFWEEGEFASLGIERMAEMGRTTPLDTEMEAAMAGRGALHVIRGGPIDISPGAASASLLVSREYPLVTLVSMVAPSPDWFVGVTGLSLFENGNWVNQKVVPLFAYDAGTDSGPTFTSPDADTLPRERIHRLTTGAFANGTPLGSFIFTRKDLPALEPLILNGGRFRADLWWQDFEADRGTGNPVVLTDDSGYFWFFDDANVEAVVKVLTGCSINEHYWVFAAGLTNVEVNLLVTDTLTGDGKLYLNPLGQAFQPLQDTTAFATCP